MDEDIVVIGTGGHGREMMDVAEAMIADGARWRIAGFLDDDASRHGTIVEGHPVLGSTSWLTDRPPSTRYILGIGQPAARRRVVARLAEFGVRAVGVVHPSAIVSRHAALGEACAIMARSVVSNRVRLGAHVHVNLAATISHDCEVGDFATLAPGAHLAGNVRVEEGCDIGIGAIAIQGVTIGAWSILGAGAVAIASVPRDVTAVGVPVRVSNQRAAGWQDA